MIQVVCGIIFNNGKVFIARRKKGKSLAGYWEFPGGKIEKDETQQESLERELIEELEMQILIVGFVGSSQYDYGTFKIELIGYRCTLIRYEGKLTDHDRFDWVSPERLLSINLAPADVPLAHMILNEIEYSKP